MPQITVQIPNKSQPILVNTNIQFPTDVVGSVPNTCQKILPFASTSGKEVFLQTYKINELKSQFDTIRRLLSPTDIPSNTELTKVGGYNDLNEYLRTVETTQLPILRLVAACLDEEGKEESGPLKQAQQEFETAKTRYELVDDEPDQVSYYESWFPIARPLKESSLFILFGISVFMLIVSILSFLKLGGIELELILPKIDWFEFTEIDWGEMQKYLIGGAVAGGVVVAIGVYLKFF